MNTAENTALTRPQAQRLQRDGFLRLPGAVPADLVQRARRLLYERMGQLRRAASAADSQALQEALRLQARSGASPVLLDLFERSSARAVLERAFDGPVRPVRGAQLATLFPAEDDALTNEAGYLNADTPYYGWCGHLDGLWNGGIATPPAGQTLSTADEERWRAPRSTNGAERSYGDSGSNIANFAALVGVALSDQRVAGSGNLGVLRGGHRHMETFFRWQRDQGGPLGPDGPGWPREHAQAPNGHGLVHYPPRVRARYRRAAVSSADGVLWPKPTFLKLRPGDAVIVHWATPHSASRVMTSEPRLMVYFRILPASRPEANERVYPAAICDNWLEWPGLRRVLGTRADG